MPSGEKSDKTKIESLVVDTAECSNRTNYHKHKSKLVLESIKQANIKLWKTTRFVNAINSAKETAQISSQNYSRSLLVATKPSGRGPTLLRDCYGP